MPSTLKFNRNYKKILIVCPAGAISGGPEALHQLASHMNSLGLKAYMCYLPFTHKSLTPQSYERYMTQTSPYEDSRDNLIIFPEVFPMLALNVKYAQVGLWWLSLDNFLERRYVSSFYDKIRYFKRVIQGRRPWGGAQALKKLLHFSQTEHSSLYLRSFGIEPTPLIDSINEDFLTKRYLDRIEEKQDLILYNPTKGWKVTYKIIEAFPNWKFEPIKGLDRDQLTEKLFQAKLYIDFGHHPGRDRLPREAAMHGCCIISGKLGSASNDIDLPIPSQYKIDSNSPRFIKRFEEITSQILENFPSHYAQFNSYREWLMEEPQIFRKQIENFFFDNN